MVHDWSANYLFSRYDGPNIQKEYLERLKSQLAGLNADRILNSDIVELAEFYVATHRVEMPVLRVDDITAEHQEKLVEIHDGYRNSIVTVSGESYRIEMPFDGRDDVFHWSSNSYSTSPPRAIVESTQLVFEVTGQTVSAEQVQRSIKEMVESVEQYLGWARIFWADFDQKVRRTALSALREREAKLLASKTQSSALANLGIKLKVKPADPKAFTPPPVKAVIATQMPPMRPTPVPDPSLDRETYEKILGLVRGAGRSIEQSSSRTRSSDEESLRDMFLVPLNAHFGTATGEAFNYTGKTDIAIKREGGNLFVAECKFWAGAIQFAATIDQLLGYLTWRDTKTAVIIFNRNIGFSGVLQQMTDLPKAHSQYVSGPRRLDETSNEFTFSLPNDADRHVTVAILAFDLGPKN